MRNAALTLAALSVAGCGAITEIPLRDDGGAGRDSGFTYPDFGLHDATMPPTDLGRDATLIDLGPPPVDFGVDSVVPPVDFGPPPFDAGPPDLGPPDLGPPDLGPPPCDPAAADALRAFRVELPCTAPAGAGNLCPTVDVVNGTATIGGPTGVTYDITIRVRGVIEERTYVGGVTTGFWNEGGTLPAGSDGYNSWGLVVSSPRVQYWLNAGRSGAAAYSQLLDEMHTIRVTAGATVTLTGDSLNGREYDNRDRFGAPIVIPGIPPDPMSFDGELVQVDVVSVACVAGPGLP